MRVIQEPLPDFMRDSPASGAILSQDQLYRYVLWRSWTLKPQSWCIFVMLNPSTADGNLDDATIRRCIRFAREAGFDGMIVLNLFAFRSRDPGLLRKVEDPIGPYNDGYFARICAGKDVICAWGASKIAVNRGKDVVKILKLLECGLFALEVSKKGHPKHPLYLAASNKPHRWYV